MELQFIMVCSQTGPDTSSVLAGWGWSLTAGISRKIAEAASPRPYFEKQR